MTDRDRSAEEIYREGEQKGATARAIHREGEQRASLSRQEYERILGKMYGKGRSFKLPISDAEFAVLVKNFPSPASLPLFGGNAASIAAQENMTPQSLARAVKQLKNELKTGKYSKQEAFGRLLANKTSPRLAAYLVAEATGGVRQEFFQLKRGDFRINLGGVRSITAADYLQGERVSPDVIKRPAGMIGPELTVVDPNWKPPPSPVLFLPEAFLAPMKYALGSGIGGAGTATEDDEFPVEPDGGGGGGGGLGYQSPAFEDAEEMVKLLSRALVGHEGDTAALVSTYMAAHRRAVMEGGMDPTLAVRRAIRSTPDYKRIHRLRPETVDEDVWIREQMQAATAAGVPFEEASERALVRAQLGATGPVAEDIYTSGVSGLPVPAFLQRLDDQLALLEGMIR